MPHRADVRVVIPSRSGMKTLPQCLETLRRSRSIVFELVLVDDGDNPGIVDLAREYSAELRVTGGGEGAGRARNVGTAGFTGEVIVFVDADVAVEPDALASLVALIREGTADAAVGRYGEDASGLGFAQAYKQSYLAHTYGRATGYLHNQFWTALGAIRAEVFISMGGFCENFSGAGPEDIEFGTRLTAGEKRILAVPDAAGRHMAPLDMCGLASNDLRKGTEDIYIHWMTGASLTDNRHADSVAILSVVSAGSTLALLPAGLIALLSLTAWLVLRRPLLAALMRQRGIRSAAVPPVTFMLDIVRGLAVVLGTAAATLESATRGRWKPFRRRASGSSLPIPEGESSENRGTDGPPGENSPWQTDPGRIVRAAPKFEV